MLECIRREEPDVLIVDSIQTLYNEELDAPAGGVGQVKDCTMALMQVAKGQGVTVFVIGHVNKEGSIAGPQGAGTHGGLRAVPSRGTAHHVLSDFRER